VQDRIWRVVGSRQGEQPLRTAWLPTGFKHVAVRIEELDTHMVGLVPLLDDGDAVGCEAIPEASDGFRVREVGPKVEETRQADRPIGRPESQRETVAL
jgi:hypothetical protein